MTGWNGLEIAEQARLLAGIWLEGEEPQDIRLRRYHRSCGLPRVPRVMTGRDSGRPGE